MIYPGILPQTSTSASAFDLEGVATAAIGGTEACSHYGRENPPSTASMQQGDSPVEGNKIARLVAEGDGNKVKRAKHHRLTGRKMHCIRLLDVLRRVRMNVGAEKGAGTEHNITGRSVPSIAVPVGSPSTCVVAFICIIQMLCQKDTRVVPWIAG